MSSLGGGRRPQMEWKDQDPPGFLLATGEQWETAEVVLPHPSPTGRPRSAAGRRDLRSPAGASAAAGARAEASGRRPLPRRPAPPPAAPRAARARPTQRAAPTRAPPGHPPPARGGCGLTAALALAPGLALPPAPSAHGGRKRTKALPGASTNRPLGF